MIPRLRPRLDYDGLARLVAAPDRPDLEVRARYEETLRAYFGAARVFSLASGRAALWAALKALGLGRRDEVAIPALTCPAVADAVLAFRGVPHLIDVAPRHFGIEVHSLKRVLARGRTRVILTAPLFGGCPPEDEVAALAAENGIPWIEDAAQAFGAYRGGRPLGGRAPLAVISTNFDKPFTTGRGGALVVNDPAYAEAVAAVVAALPEQPLADAVAILKGLLIEDRLFGSPTYDRFYSTDLGYLYARAEGDAYALLDLLGPAGDVAARHAASAGERLFPIAKRPLPARALRWFFPRAAVPALGSLERLHPLLAAAGEVDLRGVEAEGARRRALAARFDAAFASEEPVRPPAWGQEGDEPWPIRYPAFLKDPARRPDIIARLAAAGYEAGPFIYPRPISGSFPYYKLSRHAGRFLRGAWRIAAAIVNLPLHAGVGATDVDRMAEVICG